jgi:hypothetical protein
VRYDYTGLIEECIQESNESYQRSPMILINQEISPAIARKRETVFIVCFASFYSLFLVLKLENKCENSLGERGMREVGPV